jgi:HEAT repeat protein
MNRLLPMYLAVSVIALSLEAPRVCAKAMDESPGDVKKANVEKLITALEHGTKEEKRKAARELEDLGPAAKAAIVPLLKALEDDDKELRRTAANALGEIGSDAIPHLLKSLESKSGLTRHGAVVALSRAEQSPGQAIEPMIKLLEDGDLRIRDSVVDYMTVHRNKSFVRPLIRAMQNDIDARVRIAAAASFSNYGKDAREAIPALVGLINGPTDLGTYAAGSLMFMGADAVPSLLAMLDSSETNDRLAALLVLAGIGAEAKKAVPRLCACLDDPNESVRLGSMRALGAIGPEAKAALPNLFTSLKNASVDYQLSVASAIYRIDLREAEKTVPILSAALKHRNAGTRLNATLVLQGMGPAGKDAIPQLIEALSDNDVDVRVHAIYALRETGPKHSDAVDAIERALKDENAQVRRAASEALESVTRKKAKE